MHSIYYKIPDLNHEAESFLYGLMLAQGIFQTKYFICIKKQIFVDGKQVEYRSNSEADGHPLVQKISACFGT
jgi:hypothetical protein